jgi:multiple sugar transport system ATP-binding protein
MSPSPNLDAKLRVAMRAELQELHHELKTATIYVTHDQVEAMTLGERVAVTNFFSAKLIEEDGSLYVANAGCKLKVPRDKAGKLQDYLGREVIFGIRPENLKAQEMTPHDDPEAILEVLVREPLGDELIIHGETGGVELVARLAPRTQVAIDQMITLVAEMEFIHVFDRDTGETVV